MRYENKDNPSLLPLSDKDCVFLDDVGKLPKAEREHLLAIMETSLNETIISKFDIKFKYIGDENGNKTTN